MSALLSGGPYAAKEVKIQTDRVCSLGLYCRSTRIIEQVRDWYLLIGSIWKNCTIVPISPQNLAFATTMVTLKESKATVSTRSNSIPPAKVVIGHLRFSVHQGSATCPKILPVRGRCSVSDMLVEFKKNHFYEIFRI